MEYAIRELAALAGVSARTLRWYDRIGLLRPSRIGENGYRYYDSEAVSRLEMILFYRAIGLELKRIRVLLDDPGLDRRAALRAHLTALEAEQVRLSGRICAVKRAMDAEERNEVIMDAKKFEQFKQDTLRKNEEQYGREARQRYGDSAVSASNQKIQGLTQEEYADWQALGESIRARLEAAVAAKDAPDGPEGRAIAALHRRWLGYAWKTYNPGMHRGLVEMYVQDDRFRAYYDTAVPGCAQFLRDAVIAWLGEQS